MDNKPDWPKHLNDRQTAGKGTGLFIVHFGRLKRKRLKKKD